MKPNPISFLLLKVYAMCWTIVGAFYLSAGIVALLRGKFEFHVLTFGLLIGIGLFSKSHAAWEMALGLSSGFLAMLVFVFFIFITSNGSDFGSSVVIMSWGETDFAKISNAVFFPVSFCLLAGQVWLLLSKSIRHFFSDKTSITFADGPATTPTTPDLGAKNKIGKRSNDASDRPRKSLLRTDLIVICPECKTRVLPNTDGTCPSCQTEIPVKSVARTKLIS